MYSTLMCLGWAYQHCLVKEVCCVAFQINLVVISFPVELAVEDLQKGHEAFTHVQQHICKRKKS